ncbi:hypothetical protein J7399_07685 [Shimia sp. R9_1]|uniref:HAD family hydrolase n=1 Tax=Shimia sp. R9_1 TaxID=2821111 RepID=UPI001ADD318C|nr:HAD family hydrolase [Shimia sp. R9_1]MBO9407303.1 hypothetical protein [Shimia sp. R9_1]
MIEVSKKTQNRINQLTGFMRNPEVKVISFDIFDTLLCRPVVKPTDLFDLVEEIAREKLEKPFLEFSTLRKAAEKQAREICSEDEVTLNEIYSELAKIAQFPEDALQELKDLELTVERDLLQPRQIGTKLFEAARSTGKKVVITSDMYLPRDFIVEQLERCGFAGFDKLYLSSDLRITKHSGRLYRHLLADLECEARQVVHFGDNKHTDILKAEENGLSAYHLPKAIDVFLDHKGNRAVWYKHLRELELGARLLLGLSINSVFDINIFDNEKRDSLFAGNANVLGYYGVGLMVFGLTKWIMQQAEADGFKEIHFLARDGKLPMQAFDKLKRLSGSDIQANYLMASRSLCYPLQMNEPEDVSLNPQRLYVHPQTSIRTLLETRLGLSIDAGIKAQLAQKGYKKLDHPPESIEKFFIDCQSFSHTSLRSFENEKQTILDYYDVQISDTKTTVLFDIGYRARVQKLLSGHWKKPVHAYYLMSFSDMHPTYFSKAVTRNYLFPPQARGWITPDYYTAILELLISDVESGSVLGVSRNTDGEFNFEFEDNHINSQGRNLVRTMQDACLKFFDEYVQLFGKYDKYINILPRTSMKALEHFMTVPSRLDAELFKNVSFSNGIIGDTFTFIRPDLGPSYWQPGVEALSRGKETYPAQSSSTSPRPITYQRIRSALARRLRRLLVR